MIELPIDGSDIKGPIVSAIALVKYLDEDGDTCRAFLCSENLPYEESIGMTVIASDIYRERAKQQLLEDGI